MRARGKYTNWNLGGRDANLGHRGFIGPKEDFTPAVIRAGLQINRGFYPRCIIYVVTPLLFALERRPKHLANV